MEIIITTWGKNELEKQIKNEFVFKDKFIKLPAKPGFPFALVSTQHQT